MLVIESGRVKDRAESKPGQTRRLQRGGGKWFLIVPERALTWDTQRSGWGEGVRGASRESTRWTCWLADRHSLVLLLRCVEP